MRTIAKLVAAVEADPRGLTLGLRRSADEIRNFKAQIDREMSKLPTLNVVSPTHFNKLLKDTKGDIDKASEAAQRLNDNVDRIRQSMLKMRAAAQQAGDARLTASIAIADPFARGMRQPSTALDRVPAIASPAAREGISRTNAALIGVLFTLSNLGEQLASQDTKWNKLERTVSTALQAISGVALAFGPTGYVVSAISIASSFMLDFFAETREQAQKTTAALKEQMDRMLNSRDTMAQMSRAHELWAGTPSTGYRGIARLERERQPIQNMMDNAMAAGNTIMQRQLQRALDNIDEELMPLILEFEMLKTAIMDVNNTPLNIRGLDALTTTASAPRTAAQGLDDLVQKATNLVALHNNLAAVRKTDVDLELQILHIYDQLGAKLETITDQFSNQAISIKRIRNDIEAIDGERLAQLVSLVNRAGTPQVSSVPNLPPMKAPPVPPPPQGGSVAGAAFAVLFNPVIDVAMVGINAFTSALAPAALILRAIGPGLELFGSLLDSFVAPLAAVIQVIVAGLEPAFRLLFPVVKAVAWVLSIVGEVGARITAVLARGIGNFIMALGELLKRLTFGLAGNSVKNAGQSLINFADETRLSADEMGRTRRRLEAMTWGQTANDITGLGDAARGAAEALRNVPEIFKIAAARWRAQAPYTPVGGAGPGPSQPQLPPPGGGSWTPGGGHIPMVPSNNGLSLVIMGDVTVQANDAEDFWASFENASNRESLRRTGRSGRLIPRIV